MENEGALTAAPTQAAPLQCPKCESTDIEELTDGMFERRYFEWNGQAYVQVYIKNECVGSTWIQCADCGEGYQSEDHEKFESLVAS